MRKPKSRSASVAKATARADPLKASREREELKILLEGIPSICPTQAAKETDTLVSFVRWLARQAAERDFQAALAVEKLVEEREEKE